MISMSRGKTGLFARFLTLGLQSKGSEMDLIKGTAVIDQEWLKEWHETASKTELNKRHTVWKVVGLKTAADCTYITSLDGATFVTILSGVFSGFIPAQGKCETCKNKMNSDCSGLGIWDSITDDDFCSKWKSE